MEFVNQAIEAPKKSTELDALKGYQELSLSEIISFSESDGATSSRRDPFSEQRNQLEKERLNLEEQKNALQAKLDEFERIVEEQKSQMEQWKSEAVEYFSSVVFKLCDAILREELKLKPDRLQELIQNLVQKTVNESDRKLVINPEDASWLKENKASFITNLEKKYQVALCEDEKMRRHAFVLETSLHQYTEDPFLNLEWLQKELYPTQGKKTDKS